MTIKESSHNVTKKHIINARSSQSFVNWTEPEQIIATALVEDVNTEGNTVEYAYIWTDTNTYAGNSKAIREIVPDLVELINAAEECTGVCHLRKSNSGKEFITLELV